MADWENIPRLDPALQDEIDNVQLKHNALVEAVRGYPGGSIAGKTNEVMGTHQDNLDTVATREKTLISALGQPEPSPSMLLDFASQTYFTGIRGLEQAVDPHKYLNVSRATSKWVMGPQGKLVEVPPNTLAYEYDPVTGEAKGVLIEESRTNLLTWSEDFTQADWDSGSRGTLIPNAATAPNGETTADRLEANTTESTLRYVGQVTTFPDTPHTLSVFLKPDEVSFFRFRVPNGDSAWVDLTTQEVSSEASITNISFANAAHGFTRVSLTFTGGSDGAPFYVYLHDKLGGSNSNLTAGDGAYIWGAQLEAGGQPSSYIPTEDAQVTRAADSVYRELGDGFNSSEGTWVIDVPQYPITNNAYYKYLLFLDSDQSGIGEGYWGINAKGTDRVELRISDNDGDPIPATIYLTSTPRRIAFTYRVGTVYLAVNGDVASGQSTRETFGAPFAKLARSTTEPNFNSSIGLLEYYPYAMTETELQELTADG